MVMEQQSISATKLEKNTSTLALMWKKKDDFYSLYLSFLHLGPKIEAVDDLHLKDWEEGPKIILGTGVEGQRNLSKTNAIRGRLGIGKGTSFYYEDHFGKEELIEKGLNLNQYFSYLHQNKWGLWSFFINRESFSGTINSSNSDASLTTFDLGINYTKDFSFKEN